MILIATEIKGVMLVRAERLVDERGFFARTFDTDTFASAGLISSFVQHSVAYNERHGTVRGLHYQLGREPEAKVVRCTRGSMFDVVVDLRRQSPTFGNWQSFLLDEGCPDAIYVPPGCAHGYQTTRDRTEATYLISTGFLAEAARGIQYSDARLSIDWPLAVTSLSERDRSLPLLANAELPPIDP